MELKTDYSDIKFAENGKLKLLIIVGTRPEIIRLAAVISKCRIYFDTILAHTGQNLSLIHICMRRSGILLLYKILLDNPIIR